MLLGLLVLGPGAKWWLVHVDGVKVGGEGGLAGKDLTDALETVRDRAKAMGTALLAVVALSYTASTTKSADRSARASLEAVAAAQEAQRRTHELTERGQRTDRFTAAVAQLGDSSPVIQLGGVHALALLADDSPTREFRQACIDELCAFLRLPYDPDPGDRPAERQGARVDPAEHARARAAYRAGREVRHTVIRIIGSHLRDGAPISWQGHNLDFTDVIFDGGDFNGAVFTEADVSFRGARFISGKVSFSGAEFNCPRAHSSQAENHTFKVDFSGAEFAGAMVNFSRARFVGGVVDFTNAEFSASSVDFGGSEFAGAMVNFSNVRFTGSRVSFTLARFTGGGLVFTCAKFASGSVDFKHSTCTSGAVFFGGAEFADGVADFTRAEFAEGTVNFSQAHGQRPQGLPDGVADHLS
ncbi:pentapeptide repeat-containing protein [Actinomadura coerulea]|uniref:pentapeptide repeat-containing protein n=1 Tax=Actinomadura coerulea TaxID=46159 RepID=UPI0034233895